MERFCPGMTFMRPMDLEIGTDGCLYVLENGSAWVGNKDTQLVRIEYHPPPPSLSNRENLTPPIHHLPLFTKTYCTPSLRC